jgi:hypothetical protein
MSWMHLIESVTNKPTVPVHKPLVQPPKEQEQKEKVEKPNNNNRVDKLV